MNRFKLKRLLEEKKIPEKVYSLRGGLPNEAYCIRKRSEKWEVYYSERGGESDLKEFSSEEEACQYLYKEVIEMLGD